MCNSVAYKHSVPRVCFKTLTFVRGCVMTRDRKQASSVVCRAHLWDGDISAGAGMMACEEFQLDLFSQRYLPDTVILLLSCLALP